MTEREDENRLASGWGRREAKPAQRDWVGSDPGRRDPDAAAEDLDIAGDSGPISGRASTRQPQELAPGDTLGGTTDTDTADDTGAADESEANLAQGDPLQVEPPRP
jgi:hypothetical protein